MRRTPWHCVPGALPRAGTSRTRWRLLAGALHGWRVARLVALHGRRVARLVALHGRRVALHGRRVAHAVALRGLERVCVRNGGVAAAARQRPDEDSGLRLIDMPPWCLFCLMVGSTEWTAVAFARSPVLIERNRMILIGVLSRSSAAGGAAAALPDVDQVAERGRYSVGGGLPLMAAVPGLKFHDLDRRQPGHAIGARRPRTCAGAAMRDGPAVLAGNRQAPARSRPRGQRGSKVTAGGCVQDIKPGDLAWCVGQAEPAGERDCQVY